MCRPLTNSGIRSAGSFLAASPKQNNCSCHNSVDVLTVLTVNVFEMRVARDMHDYHCVRIILQEDTQCVVFDITIIGNLFNTIFMIRSHCSD
ncbi:hypothetical protein IG631_05302 [Alternaria alternata]|nr:hypothetical protein IG631_05302 [Alternaria alternata]